MKLKIELEDWPTDTYSSAASQTLTGGTLTYATPCLTADLVSFGMEMQSGNTFTDTYTGDIKTFTYNPVSVTPDFCTLSVVCSGVSAGDDINEFVFSCDSFAITENSDTGIISVDYSVDSEDYLS